MNKSFRLFAKEQLAKMPSYKFELTKPVNEMAMGRSVTLQEYEITQELASLLTLFEGDTLRSKALSWVTTEGLFEASSNREKLLKKVNAVLTGQTSDIVRKPLPPKPVMPTKQVAGMRYESHLHETKSGETYTSPGHPGHDGETVVSQDLFSPIARQKRPELETIKIDGLGIDDYWNKHYEPKEMLLEDTPGVYIAFNLDKMREMLAYYGLKPFKYGGVDGYIEHLERGSYLPPEERRSPFDPNKQHGPDLRPRLNEKGEIADDAIDTSTGQPIYHFVGGSSSWEPKRAEIAIGDLQREFGGIMSQFQSGEQLPPERQQLVHNLLNIKKVLEKTESGVTEKGSGRVDPARKIGLRNTGRGPLLVPIPDGFDLDLCLTLLKKGLSLPTIKSQAKITNPEVFGTEWNGEGPEPDGYYRRSGDKYIIKFSREKQQEIYDAIISPLRDEPRSLLGRFELRDFFGRDNVQKDTRLNLSGLISDAAKQDKDLIKDAKVYVWSLKGMDSSAYSTEVVMQKHPIMTMHVPEKDAYVPNPMDDTIHKFKEIGYKWELRTPKERQQGFPDWFERGWGILSNKNSRVLVKLNKADNTYYAELPTDLRGKPIKLKSYGLMGTAMLAGGGTMISGGKGGGHIESNPVSPKMAKEYMSMLRAGMLGEPGGPHHSELDLPCIRDGVASARRMFDNHHFSGASKMGWNTDDELAGWGVEALYGFMGDPAFQVGYVTAEETEYILKWDTGEQMAKELAARKSREEEDVNRAGGFGINVLMNRSGVDDEVADDAIQYVIDQIERGVPIIDLSDYKEITDGVEKAFGENAYEARVRRIKNFVLRRMEQESEVDKESRSVRSFGSMGDSEGRGPQFSRDTGDLSRGRYEDDDSNKPHVRPEDIMDKLGVKRKPTDQLMPEPPPTSGATLGASMPVQPQRPEERPSTPAVPSQRVANVEQPQNRSFYDELLSMDDDEPSTPPQAPQQKPQGGSSFWDELMNMDDDEPSTPPQAPQQKPQGGSSFWDELMNMESVLLSYQQWKLKNEGEVVFDPRKKPKTGCGWNYEGAPGAVGGISIAGDADTAKTDPTGRKDMRNGRKSKRK